MHTPGLKSCGFDSLHFGLAFLLAMMQQLRLLTTWVRYSVLGYCLLMGSLQTLKLLIYCQMWFIHSASNIGWIVYLLLYLGSGDFLWSRFVFFETHMSMFQNVIFSSTEEWGTYMFSFGGTTFHSWAVPCTEGGPSCLHGPASFIILGRWGR